MTITTGTPALALQGLGLAFPTMGTTLPTTVGWKRRKPRRDLVRSKIVFENFYKYIFLNPQSSVTAVTVNTPTAQVRKLKSKEVHLYPKVPQLVSD